MTAAHNKPANEACACPEQVPRGVITRACLSAW